MSDHTDDGTNQSEQEKRIRHEMESRGYDPDNADQRARYEHDQKKVAANLITQGEASENMRRLLLEHEQRQFRNAARKQQVELGLIPAEQKRDDPSPAGGSGAVNWRDSVRRGFAWQLPPQERQAPEAQRNQIRLSAPQPGPESPHQEKKQIEVDWRLALTDPVYRRQAKEQDRSEQKERSGERRQVQGPQRSPGR